MDIETVKALFFWCMVINFAIYTLTAIAVLLLRDLICKMHKMMFKMDEERIYISIQNYLANYKLLITVFNFTPWLALVIIE